MRLRPTVRRRLSAAWRKAGRRSETRRRSPGLSHAICETAEQPSKAVEAFGLTYLRKPARHQNMKLPVTLERDETGMVIAECPAIPGCVSQGRTEEEALANIKEAIVGCLEVRAEQGLPLTVRTVEVDVAVA